MNLGFFSIIIRMSICPSIGLFYNDVRMNVRWFYDDFRMMFG